VTRRSQTERISQLVRDSLYDIDEAAVAQAILARAAVRRCIASNGFRNDPWMSDRHNPEVRSFRPTRRARSFHLTERRPLTPAARRAA
jgi:hypothetical protein